MADKQALQALFAAAYDRDRWLKQLHDIFAGRLEEFAAPHALPAKEGEDAPPRHYLGNLTTADGKKLGIFEIPVGTNIRLARNRVQLRNLVARQVQEHTLDGALAVYPDADNRWRFSYIAVIHKLDEHGQIIKEQTAHKRYTYLLGEGMQTRTAVDRFADLPAPPTLEQLDDAFATEPLNKNFYQKLYHWYERAESRVTFPNDEGVEQEVHNANSLIRLLTRLLFVWFMKEKGLANPDLFDLDQVKQRIDWERPSGYYKAILQNLFFATLNREILERRFRNTDTKGKPTSTNYQITNLYRYYDYFKDRDKKKIIELFAQTPFLNGGLFECLDRQADKEEIAAYERNKSIRNEHLTIRMDGFSDRKENVLCVPNDLFFNDDEEQPGLINLLSQYQFTVEESAPLDVEVALDPELLGLVFENLLAAYNPETRETARKQTGSYYTPREVVAYMVDESLKAYLMQAVPPEDGDAVFYRERLDDLFGEASRTGELSELEKEDGTACIYEQEIPKLIEAISRINILDPAVGSGAFPMGALQRMVSLLAILDPDNERWKEQQLARLPDLQSIEQDLKTAGKISDREARRKAEEELHKRKQEIQELFAGQDHDYLRKLYLIENCLFGVDIQPIAIQIAKLRFFISLVIEQRDPTADKDDNYGILALPNLETKFVVANTLIGLSKPEQCALRSLDIDAKEKQLQEIRHKHFNAKTPRTKRKYREQDEQLREEIAELLRNDGWQDADAGKIAHWNPYDQNASAAWFDPEWMFGVKEGFDLVIGNPPYAKAEHLPHETRTQLKKDFGWIGDLYEHFIWQGFNFVSNSGVFSYIANDSYVAFSTKKRIRELMLRNQLLHLVRTPSQTFEASIYAAIFILSKKKPSASHFYMSGEISADSGFQYQQLGKIRYAVINKLPDKKFLLTGENNLLVRLLPFKKVKDFCRVLDTGIDSGNVRQKIFFAENAPNRERLLQGRQIQRYGLYWDSPKAKYKFCDVNYQPLPIPGIGRGGKPSAKNEYWTFRGDVENHHQPERLLMRQTDDDLVVAYHNEKQAGRFYTDNTLFTILPNSDNVDLKYLLALLNSRLLNFIYHSISQERGKSQAQVKIKNVKELPIVVPEKEMQKPIIELVEKILAAKSANPTANPTADTTAQETSIDRLVYNLYNLTPREIATIGGKV